MAYETWEQVIEFLVDCTDTAFEHPPTPENNCIPSSQCLISCAVWIGKNWECVRPPDIIVMAGDRYESNSFRFGYGADEIFFHNDGRVERVTGKVVGT